MIVYTYNLLDTAAALTADSFSSGFPVSNLQDIQRTTVYRSGSAAAVEIITVDLGAPTTVNALIVLDHTFKATGTTVFQGSSTGNWASPEFQVTIPTYANVPLSYDWVGASHRWWRIKHTKASATDTFDIGRIFLGNADTAVVAPDFDGNEVSYADLTTSQRSINGQIYADAKPPARRLRLSFGHVRDSDIGVFSTLVSRYGTHSPFFVRVVDGAPGTMGEPLYVRFRELPQFKVAGYDGANYWDTQLNLEEAR